MSLLINIALPLLAGMALGTMYFGGLWLTLRKMPGSARPATLIFSSYFGRVAVCFLGFYAVSRGGHWDRLLLCLAGLIAMRVLLVRRWGERKRACGACDPEKEAR